MDQYHTANIITSCIWKNIHILMCMNLINPIQFLTCREFRTHVRICKIRGHDFRQLNTEEPHRTGLLFLGPTASTGFSVGSPSPLESWGNSALIPPILGKSMVIKLTATWRLSWMPACCEVVEKEDYCHLLRSSRNTEQRLVVK